MTEQRKAEGSGLRLQKLYSECETIFENLNQALLQGNILSYHDAIQLQHCLTIGGKLSFQKMVEMRLKVLKEREIVVLVAGEYSAGKSTFVNALMGGEYLPMGRSKTSKIVCEIRHSKNKQAKLTFSNSDHEEIISLDESGTNDGNWERIKRLIRTDVEDTTTAAEHNVKRILVEWPIKALKGFPLVDPDYNSDDDDLDPTDSTEHFPDDFLDRLNQPYARSFDRSQTNGQNNFDSSQTYRKETYSTSQSQPIRIPEQRLDQLKVPSIRSVDFASDEVSLTPTEYEQVGVSESRRTEADQNMNDNDQTVPKQIVGGAADESNSIPNNEKMAHNDKPFKFSFIDCPGIHESDVRTFKSSREEMGRCCCFFFIFDESRDDGVHEMGIQRFMKDVDESFQSRSMDLRTDLLLFFANKIDVPKENDESESIVIDDVLHRVNETWGLVRRAQVIPLEAKKVLAKHNQQSLYFNFAKKIQDHLSNCMWLWLEEQYVWLLNCLKIASCLAMNEKPTIPVKTVLSEHLQNARTIVFDVQSSLNDIPETEFCNAHKKAWSGLRSVLESVSTFNNIAWNDKDIEKEVAARIGPGQEKRVDWLIIYHTICEMICERVETEITQSDATQKDLRSLQNEFRYSILDLFHDQNEQLMTVTNMLPQQEAVNTTERLNGVASVVAPLLANLAMRGAHIFLPFYLMALPAVPIFWAANSVWEEWNESKKESMRHEYLHDRVTFMKNEMDKIITVSKMEFKEDTTDISKSVLFRYMFKEVDEKRHVHKQTEDLLKMFEYMENSGDQTSKGVIVDLFTRAATHFYIENVIEHNIPSVDIIWETRSTIGGGDWQSKVFKANVKGYQSAAAVKEFTFSYTRAVPETMFGYLECYNLRKLSDGNSNRIVKLLGTNIEKTNKELILRVVLQHYNESLLDIVKSQPPNDPVQRCSEFHHYTRECSECLQFLHDNGIIHKDIKPSNFLLESTQNQYKHVVVSDIGGFKSQDELMYPTEGPRKGIRAYLAPEITVMNTGHSKASDVYCLGLAILELWNREPSYSNMKVSNNQYSPFPREILSKCLQKEARKRATITELLEAINKFNI